MNNKILKQVQNDSVIVVQKDVTTCPPLEGGPKSLISRRGKNVEDYNQEPSPEFVSSPQLTNKFYPQLLHTDSHVSPQLNGSLCITGREGKKESIKNLVPQCPSALMPPKKKLRRFRIKSGMTFIKQPAFTLAEVLITLGIIGIVAAMTIPTLITNYQKKQTVTKLQKAISVVNQAYRLAYDDVGELSINDAFLISGKDYFNKYWAPYIKVLTYCDTPEKCGYKDNNFYRYPGTISGYNVVTTERNGITFFTADGFLYNVRVAEGDEQKSGKIFVDINGSTKPNVFGKDVFLLDRKVEDEKGGVVVPFCSDNTTEEVKKNCTTKGLRTCCAEMIKRAGWRIEKDYPWE